ncbi:MAG: cell division protein PerM, partial [Jatrophihabitans sp.]
MNSGDELPAGWLTRFRRGVLSGAGLLLLAVGLCAIPAFAVWLVPGADTTPASTAVKAGALLALSAPHGGLVLNGTEVSLTPLLVTAVLGWLVLAQARRSDSVSGLLGLTAGYGIASGLLANWATLGATRAPALRSMLAAMLFVLLVGGVARLAQAHWHRLSERWQRVVRAAGMACCCYLLAGSLLAAGMIASHFQDAVAMQRQLAPGAAGLPIALLGIAATPNAVLAAVGYLTGPGFQIGPHTAVSVVSVSHGTLPTFPLLAGVPHGRPVTVLGVLVIALLAVLAGWLVLRVVAATDSWPQRLTDAAAVAVLSAGALAAASALASGSLGSAALH